jgi:ABC-type Fe3+/spermidine/putrescine transport system ATPase subunit
MAMIFQSYALWPHMTVAQNVAYGLRFKGGMNRTDRARRVTEMLRVVQLAGYDQRYPGELSGGQQQRVAVARALVVEPEILLLDEPLSNLDANLREEMRFEIRRLHDEFKITTVYVTHDQAEAMVTSDRIVVMNKGRIEQIDAPHVLYGRPRFVAEFIGRTNLLDGVAAATDTVAIGRLRLRDRRGPGARHAGRRRRPRRDRAGRADGSPAAWSQRPAGHGQARRLSGDSVDYEIAVVDSDIVLRVVTPVGVSRRRAGEVVGLAVEASACVTLADAGA